MTLFEAKEVLAAELKKLLEPFEGQNWPECKPNIIKTIEAFLKPLLNGPMPEIDLTFEDDGFVNVALYPTEPEQQIDLSKRWN